MRMYLHDLLVERSSYALKDENPKYKAILRQDSLQQTKIQRLCVQFVKGVLMKKRNCIQNRYSFEYKNDQKLLSKICIIDQDDIFDKFCLQGSLEEIINLLIECSNGLAFSSQPKVTLNTIAKQYIVNDAIWFNPKTFQTCAGWVINEFEKAIALIFYQSQQGNQMDNYPIQNDDLKIYWMDNVDFKYKILHQIPQICKEFKNAPKKKNTKQEDILWAQLIMRKPQLQEEGQNDKNTLILQQQQINEEEINQLFQNNNFDGIYCLPLEKFTLLQSFCEKRVLRMIRDQFKEKLVKDLQEIECKEKKKGIDQKKKSKKQKKQKIKNEKDSQKNMISQDNCNSFEIIDKQDSTKDDFHCTECECNRHSNPYSDNKQIDSLTAHLDKQDINQIVPSKITEIIQDMELKQNEQNAQNDDEDNWVLITKPKKQKKKPQRKFDSSQDLQFKESNSYNQCNQSNQCNKITSPQKRKPVKINQFNNQKNDIQDSSKDKQPFSNRNRLQANTQNTFPQQTLTPQKKETKSSQSVIIDIKKINKSLENPIMHKLDDNILIKPLQQIIKIQELSLCQDESVLDGCGQNNNQTQNNLDLYFTNNTEDIDTIIMNQARTLMIKKLDMDIREFNDLILTQNQEILQMRRLIYDRIQFVINSLFREYNATVRLFGSCATGLALPESDIDIGITGFELLPSNQLNGPIQKIIEFLQNMKWVTNIRAITTSSMPLIKLQVDPSISFVESSHKILLPQIDLITNYDKESPSRIFSVDISFFQYQGSKQNWHLGQISTEQTLQWLSFYSELRPIVLLFKSLLKKRGLNDQYKGGISSFCIIQMILAFLESCYHQGQASSIGFITYKFLQFYGMEFDTKKTGINYKGINQDPFFELDEEDNQLQITIVSPITNEVISQASSFVQTILQDIRTLFLAAENEVTFFYEKLKYNKKKKGKKEERNLFQKELNKFGPLFSISTYNLA
ncbi:unnamed protein product (macronuclear) [Paramecium tetraurelia]|uniref:Poly(A) RNA polymerase mitochondrial-like central palm domain-containing protein n=1 Tax=Paramecium tetraurelia TaxID=5888 RepID=A0CR95_PARTE|nr:uncharacterized protein GSPATT00009627001 [Paramecium tetraurelia]CAK73312.1 unnamed protein product [Paramecium tetraurelia]|eukprot:XP_001440709.1 hypothetical protein (macronuclear) [Paramecium tetraurelia strain d4-2]